MAGFSNDTVYANNADFSTSGSGRGLAANGLIQNGQLWIGSTATNVGGTHVNVGVLTPGSGIAITNGPGSITIAATFTGLTWVDLAVSLNPAVKSTGYFITANSTVTMPAAPAQGDTIAFDVTGSATTLIITAPGTQLLRFSSSVSSAGGTATNTARGDSVTLVYQASSTTWQAVGGFSGNWTIA